jgi:hypothetical protein
VTYYAEIASRFARNTAGHTMTVLHDDGLYRHLRFTSNPRGYSEYWFDLITTPGQLVFSGDGESYVFRRTTDMFEFFRSGIYRDGSLHINPGYWSEKLTSNREAATTYSEKLFEDEVAESLAAAEEGYPGVTAAWAEHVESEYNIEYEEEARRALDDFRFGESYRASCTKCDWALDDESWMIARRKMAEHAKEAGEKHAGFVRDLTFTFSDTWEWQLRDFDWWFLFACHAIVWGIARYDRVRKYGLQVLATPAEEPAS